MLAYASLEDSNHCYFIEQNRVIFRFHPLSWVSTLRLDFNPTLEGKRRFQRCGSAGTRTRNQRLKRALLYRLSYRPMRETSLKYIAPNGNIVGQALRLPTMS